MLLTETCAASMQADPTSMHHSGRQCCSGSHLLHPASMSPHQCQHLSLPEFVASYSSNGKLRIAARHLTCFHTLCNVCHDLAEGLVVKHLTCTFRLSLGPCVTTLAAPKFELCAAWTCDICACRACVEATCNHVQQCAGSLASTTPSAL